MSKIKHLLVILCLAIMSLFVCTACESNEPKTYTLQLTTKGGMALEKVYVHVYADKEQKDLITVEKTDKDGKISFEAADIKGGTIVLDKVPAGYKAEDFYEIKDISTSITLDTELLSEDALSDVKFRLGDVFADMTITDTDGKTYKISELLKEKKAVVLNFWYLSCDPCRAEFPYLNEAYENYKEDIAVIALNPYDGTNETVARYKENLKLTLPMAAIDYKWHECMGLTAYPETVVIDRYGTIAFIHRGSVTDVETFNQIFEFFLAEDYKQTTIRNLKDLPK